MRRVPPKQPRLPAPCTPLDDCPQHVASHGPIRVHCGLRPISARGHHVWHATAMRQSPRSGLASTSDHPSDRIPMCGGAPARRARVARHVLGRLEALGATAVAANPIHPCATNGTPRWWGVPPSPPPRRRDGGHRAHGHRPCMRMPMCTFLLATCSFGREQLFNLLGAG